MRFFKLYEYGMWRVHAFESDPAADPFIPKDAIPISKEEADQLATQPPSSELQEAMQKGAEALGGRGLSRYPTKEFKEAIGHICVNSAHLEVTLRSALWLLADVSAEVGMAFTGGKLSMQDLGEMLTTLVQLRCPELLTNATEISRRIEHLNKRRGLYVHGLWHPGADGKTYVSKFFLTRTHAKGKEQEVSLDTMYEIAEGFLQVESELIAKILTPLLPRNSSSV